MEDNIKGNNENKEKCFVITPIGNESDPIRRHIDGIIEAVIEPALSDKYEVLVSHKINEPGTITKQIIKEIYEDKLVIVNLTERNPNVMYELAFRHSLGKPVILIAEYGTGLPADIISERTIFYKNDAKGTLELKDRIRKAESEIDFEKPSSPIYDIIKEIGQEISILNNVGALENGDENNNNKDKLGYILNRLGNIEDLILKTQIRSSDRMIPRIPIVFKYEAPIDFDEIEIVVDKLKETSLWNNIAYQKYRTRPLSTAINENIISIICEIHMKNIDLTELGIQFGLEMTELAHRGIRFIGVE